MKTIITKTFDGKKIARTVFDLENNKTLEITTIKRFGGNVSSFGLIWKKISENMKPLQLELENNFNVKSIEHGKVSRLTDKKLLEFHKISLNQKDTFFII
jgi:hypothetical protein